MGIISLDAAYNVLYSGCQIKQKPGRRISLSLIYRLMEILISAVNFQQY